jgi:hypothetical protein
MTPDNIIAGLKSLEYTLLIDMPYYLMIMTVAQRDPYVSRLDYNTFHSIHQENQGSFPCHHQKQHKKIPSLMMLEYYHHYLNMLRMNKCLSHVMYSCKMN